MLKRIDEASRSAPPAAARAATIARRHFCRRGLAMIDLATVVKNFSNRRRIVVGEAMLDCYSIGQGKRLCSEAPVPIVNACTTTSFAGGAANTAVALRTRRRGSLAFRRRQRLGGHDAARYSAPRRNRRRASRARGRAKNAIETPHRREITCCCDSIRAARSCYPPTASDRSAGLSTSYLAKPTCWSCPTMTTESSRRDSRRYRVRRATAKSGRRRGFETAGAVFAGRANDRKAELCPSDQVAGARSGDGKDRCRQICGSAAEILRRTGAKIAAVTLDADGTIVFQRDQRPYRTFAEAKPSRQTAGAGDTYLAAFSLALAAGAATPMATDIAATAAGVVVGKKHTSTCSSAELIRSLPKQFEGQQHGSVSDCCRRASEPACHFARRARQAGRRLSRGGKADCHDQRLLRHLASGSCRVSSAPAHSAIC